MDAHKNTWTEQDIYNRGIWLYEQAKEIWSYPG